MAKQATLKIYSKRNKIKGRAKKNENKHKSVKPYNRQG